METIGAMAFRRETAEHPFSTIRGWERQYRQYGPDTGCLAGYAKEKITCPEDCVRGTRDIRDQFVVGRICVLTAKSPI